MFKKLLCGVLAAAMVMTAAPVLPANTTVASAEAVKVTNGSLNKPTWWSQFTDSWKIEKGKQLTLKFTHESDFAQAYHIFVSVLSTTTEGLSTPTNRPSNYFEYAVVRGDLWAWSLSTKMCAADQNTGSGEPANAGDQVSYDGKVIAYTTDFDRNWTTLQEVLKNADVTLTVQRGDAAAKITVDAVSRTDATKKINTTATISLGTTKDTESAADGDLYYTLTAEQANVNITSADISDIPSDAQIPAPPAGNGTSTGTGTGSTTTTGSSSKKSAKITVKKSKKAVKKVSVKKGKKATLTVSVTPKAATLSLTKLTKKQKKVATATFKKKTGKLTIKGKKKGTITLKITSAKTAKYKKTTKSIKVTVK